MNRAEWMKGICHIWSRGRLISPSLPVGDDWYLNLSSQKRPTGRNLGGNRLVRRSGTASRSTVVLIFRLRMRSISIPEVLTIFLRKIICIGSSGFLIYASFFFPTGAEFDSPASLASWCSSDWAETFALSFWLL